MRSSCGLACDWAGEFPRPQRELCTAVLDIGPHPPLLSVTRDRAGQLNLLPAANQSATTNIASNARSERAAGQKDSGSQARAALGPASAATPAANAAVSTPWKVQVASVAVRGGSIHWLDETLPSPARIRLTDMALDASAIAIPFSAGAPLQFNGAMGLDTSAAGTQAERPSAPALVTFKGSATDQAAEATAVVAAWPLSMAAK